VCDKESIASYEIEVKYDDAHGPSKELLKNWSQTQVTLPKSFVLHIPNTTSNDTPPSDGDCEPEFTLTFTEITRKSKEEIRKTRRQFSIIDEYVKSANPGIKDIQ
jgi:hypothetical protein